MSAEQAVEVVYDEGADHLWRLGLGSGLRLGLGLGLGIGLGLGLRLGTCATSASARKTCSVRKTPGSSGATPSPSSSVSGTWLGPWLDLECMV